MLNVAVDKKTMIIKAAVTVFSERGFSASTISDLAQKAGVGEATIYNHFKNKLEILLSLPIPYIHDFMENCDEQLKGIIDPEEKMRKYIWQALRWSQQHRDCIKVLLTDIVPTPQYYESEAYELMKKASKLPMRFLDEGKDQGLFREDVNSRIFSAFLFGTITHLLLSRIMLDSSFELLDDFSEVAGTIITAIKINDTSNRIDIYKLKDKRERILLAAEKLFSQKMFAETTISEIAKTAKVADGTIYDYFKNKEALLFEIFNKRMQDFLNTYDETILPEKPESKLRQAIYHFMSWVQTNRPWATVYIKDIATNPKFYLSREYAFKKKHDEKLLEIFSDGKQQGVFLPNIKPELLMALFFGPIYLLCLPWALLNLTNSLIAELDDLYTLLLRAITNTAQK
jgi:AcrR family transcriptional regulator